MTTQLFQVGQKVNFEGQGDKAMGVYTVRDVWPMQNKMEIIHQGGGSVFLSCDATSVEPVTGIQQFLMDRAYARWADGWSKEQFWAQLNEREKVAVFVGNLNYQVENGGWSHWCSNAYIACFSELEGLLREKMGTESAVKVAVMVSTVASAWEEFENEQERTPDSFSCSCDEDEECCCESEQDVYDGAYFSFEATTNPLNDAFYAVNTQLLQDTEDYLAGRELKKAEPQADLQGESSEKAGGSLTKIRCQLIGRDGNAFSIMGAVSEALKKGGRRDLVEPFRAEAMSGDYDHLLQTAMRYVDVH